MRGRGTIKRKLDAPTKKGGGWKSEQRQRRKGGGDGGYVLWWQAGAGLWVKVTFRQVRQFIPSHIGRRRTQPGSTYTKAVHD